MRRTLRGIVLAFVVTLMLGCAEYERVTKQTKTFANLQFIAEALQHRIDVEGSVTEQAATALMRQYNGGRDEWGSPFVYRSRNEPEFSFIVLSLGSDRALDVTGYNEYFSMPETDIVGHLERDIVFRDGRAITAASAK